MPSALTLSLATGLGVLATFLVWYLSSVLLLSRLQHSLASAPKSYSTMGVQTDPELSPPSSLPPIQLPSLPPISIPDASLILSGTGTPRPPRPPQLTDPDDLDVLEEICLTDTDSPAHGPRVAVPMFTPLEQVVRVP